MLPYILSDTTVIAGMSYISFAYIIAIYNTLVKADHTLNFVDNTKTGASVSKNPNWSVAFHIGLFCSVLLRIVS